MKLSTMDTRAAAIKQRLAFLRGKVLAEPAEPHVDLAHRGVERRLAHLRKPDQRGFAVDARPFEMLGQVTKRAGDERFVSAGRP